MSEKAPSRPRSHSISAPAIRTAVRCGYAAMFLWAGLHASLIYKGAQLLQSKLAAPPEDGKPILLPAMSAVLDSLFPAYPVLAVQAVIFALSCPYILAVCRWIRRVSPHHSRLVLAIFLLYHASSFGIILFPSTEHLAVHVACVTGQAVFGFAQLALTSRLLPHLPELGYRLIAIASLLVAWGVQNVLFWPQVPLPSAASSLVLCDVPEWLLIVPLMSFHFKVLASLSRSASAWSPVPKHLSVEKKHE